MRALSCLVVLTTTLLLGAQTEDGKLASGPKVGSILPKSFDALTIKGKVPAGRPHCLVCEFGLNPVVLVFARESAPAAPIDSLLTKLDELLAREQDAGMNGGIIFLSPDAQSSAFKPKVDDPGKLVEEAKKRDDLIARLTARSEKLKSVAVSCYPEEGPPEWKINPKAVTLLFYHKDKVVANEAFADGKFSEDVAERFIKNVKESLPKLRK